MGSGTVDEGNGRVKSADRTLEILEALADSPQRRGLSDLSQELGIPKSSLHGILRTMVARGWVEAGPDGTRFGLGLRALRAGAAYVESDQTVSLVASLLDQLAQEFGETVHLGRLDGAEVVYLAKRESVHPLRLFSAIGRRLPAHATALGKALLAQHSPAEVDRMLTEPLRRLTPRTITRRTHLRTDLAATRDRGYAIDREENSEGIVCFAVALPLDSPDAVSVSLPISRLKRDLEPRIASALRGLAERVGAYQMFLT
jgi:DNA-binding IclR family transcriptional regulator